MKNKSINLLYRSGQFFFVYLCYFSLNVRLLRCHHFFLFLNVVCYILCHLIRLFFSSSSFFYVYIYRVCVRVFFFNKQRPFFGLLNMRCLKRNLIYERYQVLFCPSYFFLMSLWTGYRKKKKKRWAKY
jgi:hypothetical protein